MSLSIITVDSFSSTPFTGNPAAVCVLEKNETNSFPTDKLLQSIAAEMNLSETGFFYYF
jgi:PhzF family phenazine biosynthesis protein